MQRRLNEDQRAGPYDNIRQVNARPEYDQLAPYRYEEGHQRYHEEGMYEGYDDRSETLR
jgi:hypothetical protein